MAGLVDGTLSELRRALSEMNEGVRALLGPERCVPELVGELLDGHRESAGTRGDPKACAQRGRTRAARRGSARPKRSPRSYLALVE